MFGSEQPDMGNFGQYHILGCFQYKDAAVDFDEANVLAQGVGVELDGPAGLTVGRNPLVKKTKNKVPLRRYTEGGKGEKLGLPRDGGPRPSIADALHRLLSVEENDSRKLTEFPAPATPDREQLRLLAQALFGSILVGEPGAGLTSNTRPAEQKAIHSILVSRKRVAEENLFTLG